MCAARSGSIYLLAESHEKQFEIEGAFTTVAVHNQWFSPYISAFLLTGREEVPSPKYRDLGQIGDH